MRVRVYGELVESISPLPRCSNKKCKCCKSIHSIVHSGYILKNSRGETLLDGFLLKNKKEISEAVHTIFSHSQDDLRIGSGFWVNLP